MRSSFLEARAFCRGVGMVLGGLVTCFSLDLEVSKLRQGLYRDGGPSIWIFGWGDV
jgi:hypothetical protein